MQPLVITAKAEDLKLGETFLAIEHSKGEIVISRSLGTLESFLK